MRPGDDLLSALIRTTGEDGDRLSSDELLGMAVLLLIAGHETTAGLISNGMLALLRHPDQLAALQADFGLLDGAVEEMLRHSGPTGTSLHRFTTGPVDIAGDPHSRRRGARPHRQHPRQPRPRPLPGPRPLRHPPRPPRPPGLRARYPLLLRRPLARLEARTAIRTLLQRCPGLALDAAPDELVWHHSAMMRGLPHVPVRTVPAPAAPAPQVHQVSSAH